MLYCFIAIFFPFLWAGKKSRISVGLDTGGGGEASFPVCFGAIKRGRGSNLELVVDGDRHGKIPIAGGKRRRERGGVCGWRRRGRK